MTADLPPRDHETPEDLAQQFAEELLVPLHALARSDPDGARWLIGVLREDLEAVGRLADRFAGNPPPNGAGETGRPVSEPLQRDATAGRGVANSGGAGAGARATLGRNQISRLREFRIMETMAGEKRAYSLRELVAAVEAHGLPASSSAIASQLFRLKNLEYVQQPAGTGIYEITKDGREHLADLRSGLHGLLD